MLLLLTCPSNRNGFFAVHPVLLAAGCAYLAYKVSGVLTTQHLPDRLLPLPPKVEECGFLTLKDKEASPRSTVSPGFITACKKTFNAVPGTKLWPFDDDTAAQYLLEIEFIILQETVSGDEGERM